MWKQLQPGRVHHCIHGTGSTIRALISTALHNLLRQPSFFKAEGLEKLLEEWTTIKRSPEYKAATKNSKKRRELQTKQSWWACSRKRSRYAAVLGKPQGTNEESR